MKTKPYLKYTCSTCAARRGEACARLTWPHHPTRPHKARLKKLTHKDKHKKKAIPGVYIPGYGVTGYGTRGYGGYALGGPVV